MLCRIEMLIVIDKYDVRSGTREKIETERNKTSEIKTKGGEIMTKGNLNVNTLT